MTGPAPSKMPDTAASSTTGPQNLSEGARAGATTEGSASRSGSLATTGSQGITSLTRWLRELLSWAPLPWPPLFDSTHAAGDQGELSNPRTRTRETRGFDSGDERGLRGAFWEAHLVYSGEPVI